MLGWAKDLYPIHRSLTGPGVRQTLAYLADLLPGLKVHSVASGTKAFDWEVPDEWTCRAAYIEDENGRRVVDIQNHNLHVVGYSTPIDVWLDREELDGSLYSLPDQPDAIPYVTSYYKKRWGFCLTENQRRALPPGRYHAVIDADLKPGVLNYGELILPGRETKEVLLSTYVCHPSMANNELSGPVVTTALARWLMERDRRYTYRILFIPETIGSIVYLSRHWEEMKRAMVAGYVVTCIGDEMDYSYMASRRGDTLPDRVAQHVLARDVESFTPYTYLHRGSDERQYGSPGIDLPVCSVMRSRYGAFDAYHTSRDDFSVVTASGLAGGYRVLRRCIEVIEANAVWRNVCQCEPQLGKRGLYPTLSTRESGAAVRAMMNVLAYADGTLDLVALADKIRLHALDCATIIERLAQEGLMVRED